MMKNTIPSKLSAYIFTLLTPLLVSHGAISMESAWFFNEGSGNMFSQATLSGGQTWNQVDNPNEVLAGTSSVDVSSRSSWSASTAAPGSTGSLTLNGSATAPAQMDTNVAGADLTGPGAKTFVAWINPTAASGTILNYSPGGGSSTGGDLRLMIDASGYLRGEVSNGAFVYNGTSLVGDGWNMVAAIYKSGNYQFYLGGSGILTPSSTTGTNVNTLAYVSGGSAYPNFVIGTNQNGVNSFTGGIDMVAAYTGAATVSELNDIYANGIAIPEANTLILMGVAFASLWAFKSRR